MRCSSLSPTHPAAQRLAPSTAAAATLLPSFSVADPLDTSFPRCWAASRAAAPAAAARHRGRARWSPPDDMGSGAGALC